MEFRSGETSPTALEKVILNRRPIRKFQGQSITSSTLSRPLKLGDGISGEFIGEGGIRWNLKTAPSGGGLFPIDIYIAITNVDGFNPGLYYYHRVPHELVKIRDEDMLACLSEAAPAAKDTIKNSAVCIIRVSRIRRISFKYGWRAYRFILLEAGHNAQNFLLASEEENCKAVPIGGFVDDTLNAELKLDGVENAGQYLILIGK